MAEHVDLLWYLVLVLGGIVASFIIFGIKSFIKQLIKLTEAVEKLNQSVTISSERIANIEDKQQWLEDDHNELKQSFNELKGEHKALTKTDFHN